VRREGGIPAYGVADALPSLHPMRKAGLGARYPRAFLLNRLRFLKKEGRRVFFAAAIPALY
jgi:hypothetical protein